VDGTGRGPAGRVARGAAAAVAAAACGLPAAGCGVFGGVSIPTPVTMTVGSGVFTGDVLPERFTCANGKVVNPPLNWAGEPAGTRSIALVIDDSDAPITPYVYWIVFDINPATSAILEGQLPPGARLAENSLGQTAYDPPCPGPQGHDYRITVYALNTFLNLAPGTSLQTVWMDIAQATIGHGRKTVYATS
jgi:Raf kinase inhibitor-like YbhB/YbcL family protein